MLKYLGNGEIARVRKCNSQPDNKMLQVHFMNDFLVRFKQVKRVLPVFPVPSFLTMNRMLLQHRHGHHRQTT